MAPAGRRVGPAPWACRGVPARAFAGKRSALIIRASHEPQSNRRDLITISLAFFFAFVGAGACQPFVISYLSDEKGLSPAWAPLVLSLVYFTFAVFRFFIGFIIDFVGLNRAKIIGVATYALFPFIIFRAESPAVLLLGSVVWGIGAPMLWTSSLVQVMNTAAPNRYGTAAGIVRGTVMAALFAGSYLLAFAYARSGYGAVFILASGLGVVGIGAMACTPRRRFRRERPDLHTFLRVLHNREAQAVAAFLVASGLAYGIVLNGSKTHIEVHCGKEWLQVILPFCSFAAIVSSFVGGPVCDRLGRWPSFAWGFIVGGIGMVLAWAWTSPAVLMLAMFLIGVEYAIVPLAAFGWLGDNTSSADRASVMGYIFCFRDLGVALAIQLRGMVSSISAAFLVFAAVSAACAGAAFVVGARQTAARRG
ncbi:MAG: MFS transporter [Candidatus Hydrogenedentes bacterium]|nr:MFS transporter [Candidatus Hydrogenedentota bacterium]